MGGTWDLFRYPGVRSDSDMFTLGLPVRALGRQGDRRRSVDPRLRPAHRERSTASTERIRYRHPRGRAPTGRAPTPRWTLDPRGHRRRRQRPRRLADLRVPLLLRRLLRLRARRTTRCSRASTTSRATSCTRSSGPRTSTYTGKRVVVIGSGATAVTLVPALGRDGGLRSRCCSAPRPGSPRCRHGTSSPTGSARVLPARLAHQTIRDQEHRLRPGVLRVLPAASGAGPQAAARPDRQDARRRRGVGRASTSPRRTTRGTSASAWCPTRTSSRRCAAARPRSSPTPSTPSSPRGSGWPPARSSRPTSS